MGESLERSRVFETMRNKILNHDIKVVLVDPIHVREEMDTNVPHETPLALAYLAAFLEKKGYIVKIFDMNLYGEPHSLFKHF